MLVILRENIESLGQIGDVVRVKDGHARNFLLPRKLVIPADENNVALLEHHRKSLEKKRMAIKGNFEEISAKLGAHQCTLSRKVGKNDKLFGSVNAGDIYEELKKAGFVLDRAAIQMKESIKTLGVHPVSVRLHPEVTATVKVWVVKDEG